MTERPMKLYRKALARLTGAAFQPGSVSFASIPARPEEDADTLLAFALDDLERMRHQRDTATTDELEEITRLKAENERLLRLMQHLLPSCRPPRDHACSLCVPNGPVVLPGFVCRYHTAVTAIEGREVPS